MAAFFLGFSPSPDCCLLPIFIARPDPAWPLVDILSLLRLHLLIDARRKAALFEVNVKKFGGAFGMDGDGMASYVENSLNFWFWVFMGRYFITKKAECSSEMYFFNSSHLVKTFQP